HPCLHSFPTRRSSDLAQVTDFVTQRVTFLQVRASLGGEAGDEVGVGDPRERMPEPGLVSDPARQIDRLLETLDDAVEFGEAVAEDRKSTRLNSSHSQI